MDSLSGRIRTSILPLLCCILLIPAGCVSVGPDYVPPSHETAPSWHGAMDGGLSGDTTDPEQLAGWWKTLGDPALTRLVEHAMKNNPDLKQARSRVREARAQRSVIGAGFYPSLDASGAVTRSESSEATGSGDSRTFYSAGLDAQWEIDLFGGVRRSVEAADADLQASYEDLNAVLVTLAAEVALNYIDFRTYQARFAVAEANLRNQEDSYELARQRHEAGLSSELEVHQARTSVEGSRARIPSLQAGLKGSLNRISVLLGLDPGTAIGEMDRASGLPSLPPGIAVGVPADTLRQRPDIRRAERTLAAQTARIGVAEADLYPRLTLNGSIGLEALNSSDLFSSDALKRSYGPRLSLPLFRGWAIRSNIEVQRARQEQALSAYETAVLAALEEVENALVAYAAEQRRRESLGEAARSARQAYELARITYETGLADFGTLLDAQRSVLAAEDELRMSEGIVIANLVRLYKALGGGWRPWSGDGGEPHPSKES